MKRTLGLLILSLVLTQGVTGCRSSEDRSIYKSTYMQPMSVYAVYKPSNETAFSYDIPPEHQLVVEFDAAGGSVFATTKHLPTKLTWQLYKLDATTGFIFRERFGSKPVESGEVALDGTPIILGSTVGSPVDPAEASGDRSIEEIEQDLPEPDAPEAAEEAQEEAQEEALPEPDAE